MTSDSLNKYLLIILLFTLVLLLNFLIKRRKKRENYNQDDSNEKNEIYPYHKTYLLTKNEWFFYKNLKTIVDKYNLNIIAKIRFADLVEVNSGIYKFNKYFSKIKSKHIDFALVNPNNMEVKYLIELDDKSHDKPDRIQRDLFVDRVCEVAGYKLIRTYGDTLEIESILKNETKNYSNVYNIKNEEQQQNIIVSLLQEQNKKLERIAKALETENEPYIIERKKSPNHAFSVNGEKENRP